MPVPAPTEPPNAPPADVFLSYAREGSRAQVDALHAALVGAGISVFLDTADVPVGGVFPERLADALLGARVVVVFLEPVYFTRRYCRLEFRLATEPARRGLDASARHLVVSLPADRSQAEQIDRDLDEMPPAARAINWPDAAATAQLVALVRYRLAGTPERIGALLDRAMGGRDAARALFTLQAEVPQPLRLGPGPVYTPRGLGGSLRDRFVGRDDDLWRLHEALAPGALRRGHAALTAAVSGMGGVGKTQLATEYFYRYGPRHYTGGLFWLDAKGDVAVQHHAVLGVLDPTWTASLADLRREHGEAELEAILAARVRDALRRVPASTPVLFVIDDVPEPPASEPTDDAPTRRHLLDTWCPAPDEAACLATSRVRVGFEGARAIDRQSLDILDEEAGIALLASGDVDRHALADDAWREIVAWAGRLPLALTLLNRAMESRVPKLAPRAILRTAREHPHDRTATLASAHGVLRTSGLANALRDVKGAFRVSYEGLTPEAQTAVRRLACLAPEPLPTALLDVLGPECADASVQALLLARSFVAPADEALVLSASPARGVDAKSDVQAIGTMHVMIADVARSLMPDLASELHAVLQTLATLFESRRDAPSEWEFLFACIPHALAAAELADSLPLPTDHALHESRIGMRQEAGVILYEVASYSRATAQFTDALARAERAFGADDPRVLTILSNLSVSVAAQGERDRSRELDEQVLDASMRALGPEHPNTLNSMHNVAQSRWLAGDARGARALLESLLQIQTRLLGEEAPDTLDTMEGLASTLSSEGEFGRAFETHETVYTIRRRILGADDPATLRSMSNLGETRRRMGDRVDARRRLEEALAASQRVLGRDHPDTLLCTWNLSVVLRELGEHDAARHLLHQVLGGQRRVLGDTHPDTQRTRRALRGLLIELGDVSAARALDDS